MNKKNEKIIKEYYIMYYITKDIQYISFVYFFNIKL